MNINDALTQILEITRDKKKYAQDILEMTKEQEQYLKEDKVEILQESIQKKQMLIDQVLEIESTFENIFDKIKKELKVNSLEELNERLFPAVVEIKFLNKEIKNILSDAHQLHDKITNEISQELSEVKTNLKKIKQGKRVDRNYTYNVPTSDGIFFDKKK